MLLCPFWGLTIWGTIPTPTPTSTSTLTPTAARTHLVRSVALLFRFSAFIFRYNRDLFHQMAGFFHKVFELARIIFYLPWGLFLCVHQHFLLVYRKHIILLNFHHGRWPSGFVSRCTMLRTLPLCFLLLDSLLVIRLQLQYLDRKRLIWLLPFGLFVYNCLVLV